MKGLMIDYRDNFNGKIIRKRIDGACFSIRNGKCYFTSDDIDYEIEVEDIFQVYPG